MQVTTTTREEISKDAFTGPGFPRTIANPPAGLPTGRSTVTQTVRLDDFGAPVSVTAPRVTPIDSSSGNGFVELRRKGCSS